MPLCFRSSCQRVPRWYHELRKRALALNLLDPCNGGRDRGFDIEVGGVEHRCVRGRPSAAQPTRVVTLVAAQNVGQDVGCAHRFCPAPVSSSVRRQARTSGVAVTKIFTSACGQITVPISRPSSTAPGGDRGEILLESEQRRAHFGNRRRRSRLPRRPHDASAHSRQSVRDRARCRRFNGWRRSSSL